MSTAEQLARWKSNPISFIDEVMVLFDPVTGERCGLLPAEREFLRFAFQTDADGRLLYPELVFGAPKKSGKTGFAALFVLTMVLLFGDRYAEGYTLANDLEQAQSRVFEAIKRIVEASPLLMREAKITADRIVFPAFHGATINALASDYASAAGANPTISCFDEGWAYTSERSRRLWDEMVPPPTRRVACRLLVTYAGFTGESVLLEELHKRGMAQPEVAPSLHAGDGILMAWHHEPIAPWQHEGWLAQMRRSLRPAQYLRMIENRFVTSEAAFVPMAAWDRCIDPNVGATVAAKGFPVYIGVDASVKHDSSAIVVTTWDAAAQQVRLVFHRVFQPTPDDPLNFEETIEATLRDLHKRFNISKILFDPFQMVSSSQRLTQAGLPIEEYPQSVPNLTAASQNLYELINSGGLVVYPDEAMRLAVSRAIAIETSRGWRIAKEKQSHKIDVVVALAMSALAAVRGQGTDSYSLYSGWLDNDEPVDPPPPRLCPTMTDAEFLRISAPVALFPAPWETKQ
jgi:phage terminase large subunit-like protein